MQQISFKVKKNRKFNNHNRYEERSRLFKHALNELTESWEKGTR